MSILGHIIATHVVDGCKVKVYLEDVKSSGAHIVMGWFKNMPTGYCQEFPKAPSAMPVNITMEE